jgi:hypothetical protein
MLSLWRVQCAVSAQAGMPGMLWARTGLANAGLSRARAWHGLAQGGLEMLWDKVKRRERTRDGRWHGGGKGARHGLVLIMSML